jgi:hypothetical protein
VVLWLLAIPLFYLPLAGTVVYLSRRMPLEGGVYQWVKIGISPFAGFQAAWNYAFFPIFYYANSGSVVANSVAYLLGPRYDWMNNNKLLLIAINMAFFAIVLAINIRGLHLARWITGAGGALIIGLYLLVVALFAWRAIRGLPVARPVLTFTWPAITLFTVNLFSKMAFNALSGFEQAAIFAGEYHTPERNIARSVWIAARPHRSDRACFADTGCGAAFLGAGGSAGRRGDSGAALRVFHADRGMCGASVSFTDGDRMGWPLARAVQRAASAVSYAGPVHRGGGGDLRRARRRQSVPSRRTGSQPDIDGRGFCLQRALLSRHVCGSAARKGAGVAARFGLRRGRGYGGRGGLRRCAHS